MKTLYVYADFDWLDEPMLVGELGYESLRGSDSYSFKYDNDWLRQYGGLFLSADINNYPGQQYTRPDSDITPSWFKKGVEAALLAPTAVNQQKFSFEYVGMSNNHHQVRAKKGFSMIGYTKMDLGIAKYHFELGAGTDNFDWV